MHDFQEDPDGKRYNTIVTWVCKKCKLEVYSATRPRRMRVKDFITNRRLDCNEVIMARVQES